MSETQHSQQRENSVQLISKIMNYSLDHDGDDFTFSQRLARENAWSRAYTSRVIVEYKRFLFLAATAGHPVTPSVDVDEAWHLNLIYTADYEQLCMTVFGRYFHHGPTRGGTKEHTKFKSWYAQTLASYQQYFGSAPPQDIWPVVEKRFAVPLKVKVDSQQYWVIKKPSLEKLLPVSLAAILAFTLSTCGHKNTKEDTTNSSDSSIDWPTNSCGGCGCG